MHYYKFNIADWHLATSHLSLEEEAIYFKLINFYYDTETGIPKDTDQLIRRLRLTNFKDIVEIILKEFFILDGDFWFHKRCDSEIKIYHANAEKNVSNGKKGGRPKINNPMGYESDTNGNPMVTLTTNHKPLTTNQEPLTINHKPIHTEEQPSQLPTKSSIPPCPSNEIFSLFLEELKVLPVPISLTDQRRKLLSARWKDIFLDLEATSKDEAMDWLKTYFFAKIRESKFLTGRTQGQNGRKPFMADFDWVFNHANFYKIVEGKYNEKINKY